MTVPRAEQLVRAARADFESHFTLARVPTAWQRCTAICAPDPMSETSVGPVVRCES